MDRARPTRAAPGAKHVPVPSPEQDAQNHSDFGQEQNPRKKLAADAPISGAIVSLTL
jgi:hypothetical protein